MSSTTLSGMGIWILPLASTRSVMPNRKLRGTRGGGFSIKISYCSNRFSYAISTASRNPSVTSIAVGAPFRSIIAFVANVVPCIMMLKSAGLRPVSFITCRIPENIAFSGASGVVATLVVSRVGPLSTTMSVNVPPISMASRASAIKLPLVQ